MKRRPSAFAILACASLDGDSVEIEGATVVSAPCASRLRLRTVPGSAAVRLRIVPEGAC